VVGDSVTTKVVKTEYIKKKPVIVCWKPVTVIVTVVTS